MNTDCISCHNGAGHLNSVNLYLSHKTRADFAQQAAFLGKMRLIIGWSDRVLNISDDNSIFDNSGPGYNTKDDGPFYTPHAGKTSGSRATEKLTSRRFF